MWQIFWINLKKKFINTTIIHVDHDGNTFRSNSLMMFFHPEQFCLWLILQKTIHLLHIMRDRVNTIILTKFLYMSMFYIGILNTMLMALKSQVKFYMWSKNIIFISMRVIYMIHILYTTVLKEFFINHWRNTKLNSTNIGYDQMDV